MLNKDILKNKILKISLIILGFIYLLYSYILIKPSVYSSSNKIDYTILYLIINVLIIASITLYLHIKHKLNEKSIVIILLSFSVILHIFYILNTGATLRQHDTLTNGIEPGVGHFGYAFSFYKTNALPTYGITSDTIYQFYHPPLNAFIQGYFMQFFETININTALEDSSLHLFETASILGVIYMFITSLFMVKTLKFLKLKKSLYLLSASFVILFPRLTQFSGQLNNDPLSLMFLSISIYFCFRWYIKSKSRKDILLVALFLGLAFMAKMSASVVVIGIAVIFLMELINSIRKKQNSRPLKKLLLDYILFLIICLPIALWWQIYLNKVYLLPYNFVFNSLNSSLFTGTRDWVLTNKLSRIDYYDLNNTGRIYTDSSYNILIRFILPTYIPDLDSGIYCNAFYNYNLLTYAVKSSIFGEFSISFSLISILLATSSVFLLFLNYFLFIIHLIINLFTNRSKIFFFSLMLFIGIAILYIYLSISMPFGCSMDFRYVVIIILPMIMIDAISMNQTKEDDKKRSTLNYITQFSLILFLVFTTVFYMVSL